MFRNLVKIKSTDMPLSCSLRRVGLTDDWQAWPHDGPRDANTMYHFSQSNPVGTGQGKVPALLRRVADTIESLGEVEIYDITFTSAVTADEDDLQITVYYDGRK